MPNAVAARVPFVLSLVLVGSFGGVAPGVAVPTQLAQTNFDRNTLPLDPRERQPTAPPRLEPLPDPEEILPSAPASPDPDAPGNDARPAPSEGDDELTVVVDRFAVEGSTVFAAEEFDTLLAPFTDRPLTFAELLEARSTVTQYYIDNGYITSGALLPPQELTGGVVRIQVLEGGVETIDVRVRNEAEGLPGDLRPAYIRNRLALATTTPLNVDDLREALQLLQLDPRVDRIEAELSASPQPGLSVLTVNAIAARSFGVNIELDNGRSPSVGTFRRRLAFTDFNFTGRGDELFFRYTNTTGSNAFELDYSLPVNSRNGRIAFAAGATLSNVVEEPFAIVDIEADSRFFELRYRQPLIETPRRELAVGLSIGRSGSDTQILDTPFPLSAGADEEGRTRLNTLRLFQEFTQRSELQVFAVRSQVTIGIDAFNATTNGGDRPDSSFLAWRLQNQYVRELAPNTLLLVRGDLQVSDSPLLPLEQFSLGGLQSVRGYRQDRILSDNGLLVSGEVRLPLARATRVDGVLQVVPFLDVGTAWNSAGQPNADPDTLVGIGIGLLWEQGERLFARFDYGIPLVDAEDLPDGDSLQEEGFYFTLIYSPF